MSEKGEDFFRQAKDSFSQNNIWQALNFLRRASYYDKLDYAFALKASKLATKLAKFDKELNLRKTKVALLSSTTTVFLEPILKYFGILAGLDIELKCGDFGNWEMEILDESSWLYEFHPDFVIININYRDFHVPPFSDDSNKIVKDEVARFMSLWDILSSRISAKIIQNDIDYPSFDSGGYASFYSPNGRQNILRRISQELVSCAYEKKIQILNISQIIGIGNFKWEDERTWYHGRQHPSVNVLPLLANEYVSMIKMNFGLTKKVIVCDLDNTLWGGVIGEDGLSGIKLGSPDPIGEAYADFQNFLLELKSRGILLAVVSKNNWDDAIMPFEKHPSMRLKRDDIISFKANWEAKSKNILEMSKELNLGLDSFVFIDDNPLEIEEVSSALPMVECLLMPRDASEFISLLAIQKFFDVVSISETDINRHQSYKSNVERQNLINSSGNIDEYLKNFDMLCSEDEILNNLDRCTQLINKTNQFNLTTKRYTDIEVSAMASDKNNFTHCFSLKDKFGDLGIVGIIVAKMVGKKVWNIDTFLMSCRVLGRGLETFMMNSLFLEAKKRSIECIESKYVSTHKNSQVKMFYEKYGFKLTSENAEEKLYEIAVDDYKFQKVFINL